MIAVVVVFFGVVVVVVRLLLLMMLLLFLIVVGDVDVVNVVDITAVADDVVNVVVNCC